MTKNERNEKLDRIESHLDFMAKCMEQLQRQQMKQLEEQKRQLETKAEAEAEQQAEQLETQNVKDMVANLSTKINEKMRTEKLDRDRIIEILEKFGLTKIYSHRIGQNAWGVIFVIPSSGNVVKFVLDLELNNVKANVLY